MVNLERVMVLVTRPSGQAESLIYDIGRFGGNVLHFPTLAIVDPEDTSELISTLKNLNNIDLAIFVSPTAVKQVFKFLKQQKIDWPDKLAAACVGAGTRRTLTLSGVKHIISPTDSFNSEALLTQPELDQVKGKRIIIFRSDTGRELLRDALSQQGADVRYAQCYRRTMPEVNPKPLQDYLSQGAIDVIVVTSAEGVKNLFKMVGMELHGSLCSTAMVVLSKRIADVCTEQGVPSAFLYEAKATNISILEAVGRWKRFQNPL